MPAAGDPRDGPHGRVVPPSPLTAPAPKIVAMSAPELASVLAATDWRVVGIVVLTAIALAAVILVLTHLIGPKRTGPVKEMTYESGVDPFGDTRKRFNVHFYIIAMLFLLFDVEIVFFYPWASLFGRLTAPAGRLTQEQAAWAQAMIENQYGPGFFLVEMLIFIAVLGVGYVYAWRKGVFRWA